MPQAAPPAPIVSDASFDPFGVTDPVFTVTYGDGTKKDFDPFDISKKLEVMGVDKDAPSLVTQLDNIRTVFGYPTAANVAAEEKALSEWKAANPSPVTLPLTPAPVVSKTPSDYATLKLLEKFMTFMNGLDVIKNLAGLTQN